MNATKTIVLTGGGTAGHVNPNLALVPGLQLNGWEIRYIGSIGGIEQELVEEAQLTFFGIASGKLRRYFDWRNFSDPFKVIQGTIDAYRILQQLQPDLIFSKGGFVTVPVIIAAWLRKIPIVIHESDYSPGLANKLALPFAKEVWVTFPETLKVLPKAKLLGLPIRQSLLEGNPDRGRELCNFDRGQQVLLIVGGSSGSGKINQVIRSALPQLTSRFQVVHLCGKGNLELITDRGYCQFEYLTTEMKDVLALADFVLSRAGANAIFEFLALRKPHLLIPLSQSASRGDQILNAHSFATAGFSAVLPEEELTADSLIEHLDRLVQNSSAYITQMQGSKLSNPIPQMITAFDRVLTN